MNVNASKILLGVSIAGYTYCSWGHLSPPEKPPAAPAKVKELSAGMVNRSIVLALGGDPFESVKLERGTADAKKDRAQVPSGILDDGVDKPLPPLALQGILITPTGPIALINGKPLEEGEIAVLEEGKARIRARRIGEDFAVVEGAAQLVVLKLEKEPGERSERTDGAPAAAKPRGPIYQSRISSARD